MSIASSAFKRLCGLYRIVFRRMREHEARLFGGLGGLGRFSGGSAGGRLRGAASSRGCRIEQLEPRLLLDASGPQIVAHWPTGLVQPVDHVEITFNEPIDPSTLSAGGVLIMRPSPVRLGGYDTTGQARGVAVSGTRAYVADYNSGLQIIDISNAAAPVLLGGYDTTGSAMVVDLSGTRAYVADYGSGLQVLDITNPASPQRLGGYDTPGIAYGVAVSGTLAYVADFMAGLQIIDVSNPASPVRLGTYDTAGQARGVAVSDTLAYVADSGAGLAILDVSNPAAPVLVGTYDTAGSAYAVTLSGNLAYVADAAAGLQIIDVSNPAAPVLRGTYDTAGTAYGVTILGPLAYVADYDAGLQVLDVSSPAAPVLLGSYDTAGYAYGVAVAGGRAYVADGGAGLQIVEVYKPATGVVPVDATMYHINLAGALSTGTYNVRVYPAVMDLAGNAMDQDGDGTGGELPDDICTFSFTVDATPPTAPGNLAFADDTGMSATDGLTSDAELAFTWSAATDANGIARYEYRLDAGSWTATTDLGALVPFTAGQHTFEVRAVDGIGNAGPAAALAVTVDLTAPPAPTGLVVNGSMLSWSAAADANGIWKYQYRINGGQWIDSAASPVDTGMPIGSGAVLDVRAVDRAGNAGPWATVQQPDYGPRVVGRAPAGSIPAPIDHIDITFNEPINPATFTADDIALIAPAQVGFYDTPGLAWDVQVVGTLAYVADYYYGLRVIDVSNPSGPLYVGGCDTGGWARGVQVVGTLAYVTARDHGLLIFDVSNPAAPVVRGGFLMPGYAYDVQVVGSLAYVANDLYGLRIINVSNPSAPFEVGRLDTPGWAWRVQVVGTLAYIADGASKSLRIIDVSNPAAPVLKGYLDLPSYAYDVQVVGSLAYVADNDYGLRIVDVSNPAAPVQRGYYDTPGYANGVRVFGNLAYVADHTSGLRIIDVSNPAAPVEVAYYDTPGFAMGVQIVGTLAYVADESSGLRIIRVGEPAQAVSQIDATTYRIQLPRSLGDGTYQVSVGPGIADLTNHLMDQDADGVSGEAVDDVYSFRFIVDTTAPAAPGSLAFADNTGASATDNLTSDTTPNFTWSASTDLNGIARYEYRWDGGQWSSTTQLSATIAASEGAHLFEVRAVDPAGNASPITSRGITVDTLAPQAPSGLRLDGAVLHWDKVTDANGTWKYQYAVAGGAWADVPSTLFATGFAEGTTHDFMVRAIDRAGNVGAGASATFTVNHGPRIVGYSLSGLIGAGVDWVEVTFNEPIDPATFTGGDVSVTSVAPVQVGYYDTWGMAWDVDVVGMLAYVADYSSGLRILDVSNPAAPVQVGYYDTPGYAYGVQVVGTLAYVGDSESGLRIIDVSNPAAPKELGYCDTPGYACDVQVVGSLAYVADGYSGLRVIDVSNPGAPVQRGYYDTTDFAYGVQVVGTLAYVADGSSGLRIIDVSNPAAPVQRGYYDTTDSARGVQIVGTVAYVADYGSGLQIIDVSNPAAPVRRGYYDTPSSACGVQVIGTVAYVADYGSGLQIIDVSNPAAPVQVSSYNTPGEALGVHVVGMFAYVADGNSGLGVIKVGQAAQAISQVNATTYRIQLPGSLAQGTYQVSVWPGITDLAGNTMDQNRNGIGGEVWDDVYSFIPAVDVTAPTAPGAITFTDNTGISSADDLTSDTSLTVSWAPAQDLNGIGGYEYRWDGGDWTAVAGSSAAVTGGEGEHLFEVRALDQAGNLGPATSLAVTIDTSAPLPPVSLWLDGSVLHWAAASDPNGIWKYQYRVNGGDWAESLTLQAPTGLVESGSASFGVRAVDRAGNAGPAASAVLTADYGPGAVSHAPDHIVDAQAGHIYVTFDEAVDAGTFTAEDVAVAMAGPAEVSYVHTRGEASDVHVVGTLAYVTEDNWGLGIIDVSNPAAPVQVGYIDTDYASEVQVVGSLAYVADGWSGLGIFDVSNPAVPVLVSHYNTPNNATSVQVVGTLAYVGDGSSGMRIIDVSNPAAPVQVGYYDPPGGTFDVCIVGTLAYMANWEGGLRIVNVSNPAAPVEVGFYNASGYVYGIQVVGKLAYVAYEDSVFGILDVSNPAAPVQLGYRVVPGAFHDIQIIGSMAYVADAEYGLRVIDVSNSAAPVEVGYYATPGAAYGVQIVGVLAYVADYGSGLRIIKVGQAVQGVSQVDARTYRVQLPQNLPGGTYQISVWPGLTDLAGNTMDQDGDGVGGEVWDDVYNFMLTVDATPPTAPGSLAFTDDTGVSATDRLTSDSELVFTWSAATDANGIARYEYRLDGGGWTATTVRTATVSLADGSHTFDVRAVDNPGNAGPAASLGVTVDTTVPAAPGGLAINGSVLSWDAASDANGIWKYQYRVNGGGWIDNAGTSVDTGVPVGSGAAFDVRAWDSAGNAGPLAAVQQPDYGPRVVSHWPDGPVGPVDHVDLTFNEPINPATLMADDVRILLPAPLNVGGYDSAGFAYGVAVSGTTAYVADENRGLAILDVSNPAAPVRLGGYDTAGYAHGVAVSGGRAYVADYNAGLQIIDVSDPFAPLRLGGYDTAGYAYGVAVAGTLAYVADYSAGLQIIDVSNPSAPQRLGGYNTAGFAFGVALSGTLAYVADGSKGLAIIDVSNPAAPQKVGGLDTAGSAMGVAVYGTLAFVADYTAGVQVIDVSNPSAPVLVGTYDTAGAAYGVTVSGPLAFVADYGAGLVVLDVSDPSAPRRLAGLDTPGAARAVAVSGTRAYVADETAGLQVINVLAEVSGVMQTGDATYRIDLPGVLPDGEYRVFVGPEVTDLAGNAMDQNANGIGGQVSDALGFSFTTNTASPAPAVPSVAGRHVFYNNSVWDVGNFALNAANAASDADDADDGAIAANVSALLPGQIAGPENRTAFSRGINGVMVDVANMFADGLTAADFTFRVGAGGDASAWRAAPPPAGVTVRAGAGDGGSSRVTITWPDGAIVGCWLEVTVLSDASGGHAGLGADDVFCFGNLPGDFNRDGSVDAADYIALKQAFGSRTTSAGASADFDGSGAVDYGDLLTLMGSFGQRFVAAFCPPAPALAPSTATPTATMTPTAPATAMAAPDPASAGPAPAIVNDPDAELAAAEPEPVPAAAGAEDAGPAPAIVNETDTELAAAEPVASEAAAGAANQAVLTADEAISTANQVVLTANDAVLPADQPIATADDRGRVDENADVLAMSAAAALADTQPALTVPTSEGSTILNLAEAGAPLPSKLPGVSLPAKLAGLLQPSLGAVAVTAGNFDVLAGLTTAPALSEMSLGTDGAFAVDLLLLRPVDLDVLPSPL